MIKSKAHQGIRPSSTDRVFEVVITAFLLLLLVIVLFPLLFVVSASVSSPLMVIKGEVLLWPREFTLDGYRLVFSHRHIMRGYGNSILYTSVGTLINLVMTTLCAYPLSRRDLKGRQSITFFISFTMLFSGGMIPSYLVINGLGLIDTFWVMVIPGAISAWNMLIMKNYFQTSIPYELQEAAKIDGACNGLILLRVILPLSMPIVAVMTIFYGVSHWNAYFGALIYLNDASRYPLQLVLRNILSSVAAFTANDLTDTSFMDSSAFINMQMLGESMKYAAIVVASVPVMILYPLMQRYFVKGVMLGAIKG